MWHRPPIGSGSIPAPAGEPPRGPPACCRSWVYPRACGGTFSLPGILGVVEGLSPRLRGNPACSRRRGAGVGSIPAPAGEPITLVPENRTIRVYPRACGGTGGLIYRTGSHQGLSPRLRGNPSRVGGDGAGSGSIPAPAGEPRRAAPRLTLLRVYPRACGGTVRSPLCRRR